mmetsp:Transcript_22938/g.33534  ORF Transcript_22938/g.33534 Transcript_22938/m.33534 type:complete len:1131 (+) Transcript_22938:214-3606(+)|eukprot:CAMPEP_0185040436 /NCGR_PEP_ID=MMETSP1103-20130426/38472_1 /TAXON_ID=36769 /ORGANISM="Paraphysomonas bandaiensis, Strain Caron Lab Isolate" /LENGTH=1130 /DNA_ID=CAMNT_0027579731 /DNA_START=125 /DNA_END=3517 /DNA_ORIENTATION=-
MQSSEFEKLPDSPSPNERIVYMHAPPLTVEVKEADGQIVLSKCLDEALSIPSGAVLTHLNEDDVRCRPVSSVLAVLSEWSNTNGSASDATSLVLRFQMNSDQHVGKQISGGGDPARSIFVTEVGRRTRAKLGLELRTAYIQRICALCNWDRAAVVSLVDRLLEDYLELGRSPNLPISMDMGSSERRGTGVDKDLLDDLPAVKGGEGNNDYVVSLLSRQLGMTIENVLERTIVRSVHPNSEAFKLGVRTNSVILNIGSASTLEQTHLETLEALKNTVRPVKLRLCQLNEQTLSEFRGIMQSLVQRQGQSGQNASSTLTWVERRVLWVMEVYSFAECVAASAAEQVLECGVNGVEASGIDSCVESGEVERMALRERIEGGEGRAIKVLQLLECARRTFSENERREALVHMRCAALSEVMYDLRDSLDWASGSLCMEKIKCYDICSKHSLLMIPPVDLVNEACRSICYAILQITNDQQTGLQQVFPDRATCDVLDLLVRNSMTGELLQSQHVPTLWKLTGSNSVPARIACANLVPLVYVHLSALQRLRIRGLVNRLMVDSVGSVRAYVLSSVCVRILRSVVQRRDSEKFVEPESITLNWVAHCMVQGCTDIETDVRRGALQACKNLIEYSSLGVEDNSADSHELVKEMEIYLSDDRSPQTFCPEEVVRPNISDVHIMFCRVMPIISRLVEDTVPEIRGSVVSMCGDFCIWMGGKWSAILLDVLLCCFRDPVPEVRAAALSAVPHAVMALIQAAIQSHGGARDHAISKLFISLIPAVCSMNKDSSVPVRVALCSTLSSVLSLVYSVTMNGHLTTYSFMSKLESDMCGVVLLLLDDKSPLVATQMIVELASSVEKEYQFGYSSYTSSVFTVRNSPGLIRSALALSKQTNWRVRRRVCSVIPKLVAASTTVEGRSAISSIITPLLSDAVFDVRRSAARALCLAAESDCDVTMMALKGGVTPDGEPLQDMGRMWLDCVVLPQLETLRTSRVFSNRILSLHMIATILIEDIVHEGDVRYNILINIALTLASDRVPNVRIALCEVLGVLAPLIRQERIIHMAAHDNDSKGDKGTNVSAHHPSQPSLVEAVMRSLDTLTQDPDTDVSYFAARARQYLETGSAEGYSKVPSFVRRKPDSDF